MINCIKRLGKINHVLTAVLLKNCGRKTLSKDGWLDGWMSHAGIVSKRLKISSNFFLGLVAYHYGFLIPHYIC